MTSYLQPIFLYASDFNRSSRPCLGLASISKTQKSRLSLTGPNSSSKISPAYQVSGYSCGSRRNRPCTPMLAPTSRKTWKHPSPSLLTFGPGLPMAPEYCAYPRSSDGSRGLSGEGFLGTVPAKAAKYVNTIAQERTAAMKYAQMLLLGILVLLLPVNSSCFPTDALSHISSLGSILCLIFTTHGSRTRRYCVTKVRPWHQRHRLA
mmetsp:Transcript_51147/g.153672  ORF Transcript_51147/g.153672 Transcript_51147/m.153672 type:complete len:206 (-) Transcript_51147:49-666(-)